MIRSEARANNPKATVFVSSTGTQVEPRSPNQWLKDRIISGMNMLNEAELKNLSSKTWRHAWANWAKDDPRDDIRKMDFAMLSHSEQISNSNYHQVDSRKAADWTGGVLEELGVRVPVTLL